MENMIERFMAQGDVGQFWADDPKADDPRRPLLSWLLTTDDWEVAEAVALRRGGTPRRSAQGPGIFELALEEEALLVCVGGPDDIVSLLVHEGERGPVHVCDGERLMPPMVAAGSLCGCPRSLFERKAAARTGRGPRPDVHLRFRLVGMPMLGYFSLASPSWEFFDLIGKAVKQVNWTGDEAEWELRLQRTCLSTRSGVEVAYVRPGFSLAEREASCPLDIMLAA
ncbi:hypothetical protein [Streptomyces sp. NPDC002067]